MPINMGAKEAAEVIRSTVHDAILPPEDVHKVRFLQEVAAHLNMEPMPENLHRIAQALHQHDIGLHEGHEFPKMVKRGYDGADMVANDEQEEKEIVEATRPEPVNAKPAPTSVLDVYDDNLPQAKLVEDDAERSRRQQAEQGETRLAAARQAESEQGGQKSGEASKGPLKRPV